MADFSVIVVVLHLILTLKSMDREEGDTLCNGSAVQQQENCHLPRNLSVLSLHGLVSRKGVPEVSRSCDWPGLITQPRASHFDHLYYAGEDSCNGDSGGPLIARRDRKSSMFLWGIVSSGTRVCGSGKPGIYTRISRYGDWIKANLRP